MAATPTAAAAPVPSPASPSIEGLPSTLTPPSPAPSPSSPAVPVAEIKLHPPIAVEPVWPPTEEEKKFAPQVAKFRAMNAAYFEENKNQQIIADCIANDRACIRFILARACDLEKASAMLKEATEYRKTMKTDQILDAPYPLAPKIKEHYHHCYHTFDKEGRPVYWEQTGQLDIPLLTKLWQPEQMLHYHTHNTEYFRRVLFPAASVRAGRRIDQLTSIIDLNGLGRHHLTKTAYNFLSSVSKVDQLIYPEVLGRMIIINAGFVFSIAWAIIKPWLEERTKAKISIIRGDGKEELLKYIDADQLPRQFGGNCAHGIPPSHRGPPVPITAGCMVHSPDTINWLTLAATGLEAQVKARAALAPLPSPSSTSSTTDGTPSSPSSTTSDGGITTGSESGTPIAAAVATPVPAHVPATTQEGVPQPSA